MGQMLRRISGKRKDKSSKYLSVTDSDTITGKIEIADTLATSFAAKSSPDYYQEKVIRDRDREKKNIFDFGPDNMLLLNLSLRRQIRQLDLITFITSS